METTTEAQRPNPYKIDQKVHKVQSIELDGKERYLIRHDFTRLDSSNIILLTKREKAISRTIEHMGKGRSRRRSNADEAQRSFYCDTILGGGWRPADLIPHRDKEAIEPAHLPLYKEDAETGIWEPGWFELTQDQMKQFTVERMSNAIENYLRCKGTYIGTGNIDFMYEKGGQMLISLAIGDFDEPAYKVLFEMRRPESKRRHKFREDFAYQIDETKGDMGKTTIKTDITLGVSVFDEHFLGVKDDPAHSLVVFSKPSALEHPEEETEVIPYSDEKKPEVISLLNPSFKVEVSAAMIIAFSQTDQE